MGCNPVPKPSSVSAVVPLIDLVPAERDAPRTQESDATNLSDKAPTQGSEPTADVSAPPDAGATLSALLGAGLTDGDDDIDEDLSKSMADVYIDVLPTIPAQSSLFAPDDDVRYSPMDNANLTYAQFVERRLTEKLWATP